VKYGLDINNEEVSNFISENLKARGNFIVNFTERNNIVTGSILLSKVILAYITNIDFYFIIEFKEDISFGEIYYSPCKVSKDIGENLLNIFHEEFENIICENGEHLYLIKNIKAPVIYVKLPIKEKEEIEELVMYKIIDLLVSIKEWYYKTIKYKNLIVL